MSLNAAALSRLIAGLGRTLPEITGLQLTPIRQVVGKFYGSYIATAFQPWRRPADHAVFAWEAYARSYSKNGADQSPGLLFADAAVDSDLVTLDRLCRTVHALNYCARGDFRQPLVLNVDTRLLHAVPEKHGEFFGKVLAMLDVAPGHIIIDINTTRVFDLSRLRQIIASYRRNGFAVAVSADSLIHARSVASLLRPNLLVVDGSAFTPDTLHRHASLLVRDGVRVGVKHIETSAHLDAALAAGVECVKGYLLDRPASERRTNPSLHESIECV